MQLQRVLEHITIEETRGDLSHDICGVQIDSRQIGKGQMFVAVRGTQNDGHQYISKAIEQGATAMVCETIPEVAYPEVTYIRVTNSEHIVGDIATAFYGYPSTKFKLVGVTGTNGKTTIATTLYNMFRHMGHKAGLLSTVVNYIDGEAVPTEHTTPDPITLNRLLAQMADAGCEYVFMEVSSHSIVQNRIGGLTFAGGLFTNITRDHLDYHKTFENYIKAKKQYSVQQSADFKAKIIECHFEGMYLEINHREVGVQFIGKFNVYNLLAVYACAIMLGKEPQEVLVALSDMKPVSGRLEAINAPDGFTAIVDYAHTPDALENVLNAIHGVLEGKGRLITVCGAGGNRDKGKRPLMAQEAVRQSDKVIITSDNPRFEEPQDIINDMVAGLDKDQNDKKGKLIRQERYATAVKPSVQLA